MSNVMKIAGKTDKATVKGVRVTDNGEVCTSRMWATDINHVITTELRSTSAVTTADKVFDAGKYGTISLRVTNSHDADITIHLYEDMKEAPARWLTDANGNPVSFVVPSGDKCILVTPDDIPALSYLRYVMFRIAANKAPTTGNATIWIVGKR